MSDLVFSIFAIIAGVVVLGLGILFFIISDGEEGWVVAGTFGSVGGAIIVAFAIWGTVLCNKVYTKTKYIKSMEAGDTFVITLQQDKHKYWVKDLEGLPISQNTSDTKIVNSLPEGEQPYILTDKKLGT